jgi:hypothetical protein
MWAMSPGRERPSLEEETGRQLPSRGRRGYARWIGAFRTAVKSAVLASPIDAPRILRSLFNLFAFGKFLRSSGLRACPHFPDRWRFYQHLHQTYVGDGPIDYVEFGVFSGNSLRKWVSLNRHPASRFFGFDSFVGLPEAWELATERLEAGSFSNEGRPPEIADERVRLIKGLFQDTLASFLREFRPRHRLIIHCDADLYTSTLYVLAVLDEVLQPGTILIFDEFSVVDHEFRAFVDYTAAFRRKLVPTAWSGAFFEQVAFISASAAGHRVAPG